MGTFYFFICRCTFLLLFLAVGHGANRCKTTEDCKNPEVDEFCDQNFLACEPCSGYCSGDDDSLPLCMMNCPSKYSFFQNLFAILSYGIMVFSHTSMLFLNNTRKSVADSGSPTGRQTNRWGKNLSLARFLQKTA